tara:strand:+ start:8 stop:721 length:714 start_codon:yes stop_codon:yes gene_type:complete
MVQCEKVVVFDLDETLGHFVQLGIFLDVIEQTLFVSLTDKEFFELLDLYPEFLRPNIMNILKLICGKKKQNICGKLLIYTNNQGPKEWAIKIKKYFEHKLKNKCFDQIIAAYKVNGKQVELCRTSHDKSYGDFLACSKLPPNTKICFLDDQYHPKMAHDNVVYINLKPYSYTLPFEEMILRFMKKYNVTDLRFFEALTINCSRYNFNVYEKSEIEQNVDNAVGKHIHKHLKQFLKKT